EAAEGTQELARRFKSIADRVAYRCAAGQCVEPGKTHIHASVGSMAPRSVGCASVAGFSEPYAAVGAIHESTRCAWRVAELRHRPDQLVAPLEPLCAQRMGAASHECRYD